MLACIPEIFEKGVAGRRLSIFFHSLFFVLGFSGVFILLGIGVGLAGFAIGAQLTLLRKISGSLMVLFGSRVKALMVN